MQKFTFSPSFLPHSSIKRTSAHSDGDRTLKEQEVPENAQESGFFDFTDGEEQALHPTEESALKTDFKPQESTSRGPSAMLGILRSHAALAQKIKNSPQSQVPSPKLSGGLDNLVPSFKSLVPSFPED